MTGKAVVGARRSGAPGTRSNVRVRIALGLVLLVAACTESPFAPDDGAPAFGVNATGGRKFYVEASTGNDAKSGTSVTQAWKTLGKVSSEWSRGRFLPGDTILFRGVFSGRLSLGAASKGTATVPIVLRGNGATIVPGANEKAIDAVNVSGVEIRALDVTAPGRAVHTTECVLFYYSTGATYRNVVLRGMKITGCGSHALWIGSYGGSTLTDVLVDGLDLSASVNGLAVQGDRRGAIQRITITNTDSHDHPGRRGYTYGSGNGIQIGQVIDGLIERSRAWNNGADNDHVTAGPVGIWTWESTRVTIRYNEAWGNRTARIDGGGFDLDGGSQDCVLEYNYAHDNQGSGFLAYQYAGVGPWSNNVIRFNISERDGMGLNQGGSIRLGSASGTSLTSGWIINNTVFTDNSGAWRGSALYLHATASGGVRIANNIFVARNGAWLIRNLGSTGYTVAGNNYWTAGGAWEVLWAGATYRSLSAFRATGKEKNSGTDVDPRLAAPGTGGTLSGRVVGQQPAAYALQASSTMPGAGYDLRPVNAPLPATDYFGAPLPLASFRAVGADALAN